MRICDFKGCDRYPQETLSFTFTSPKWEYVKFDLCREHFAEAKGLIDRWAREGK